MEIFEYAFMQRAFIVGILLAAIIPCIGLVIVCKRLSMIGDALSHTSLAGVAESLGVSTSYLSRKLKAGLNTTFVDLLNQYRIKKALNMLSQGTMRIYEISDELGFSEYKHFCGVFKKYTNVTPSEFLKNGGVAVVGEKDSRG